LALLGTLVLAVTIAWGTLYPNSISPDLNSPLSDKILHVVAFAALIIPTATLYARSLIWILPLAGFFGGAIELVQPFIGREAEVADLLTDLVGLGLGTVIGLAIRGCLRRHA
jgi:VanZ family protein